MTSKVDIYKDGKDTGYLGNNQSWWFDSNFEHSFEIFDLDSFYADQYFSSDHVGEETVKNYVEAVLECGRRYLGRPVKSIAEFGCGGGWFTKEFLDAGIYTVAMEGTKAGITSAYAHGVSCTNVIQHDLRQPIDLADVPFDVAVCTEVAEHIECPFSAMLVQNIANASNLVWFSCEEPGTNEAHYHHCNEQPAKFWINLFKYYGYEYEKISDELRQKVENRGQFIFYNPRAGKPTTSVMG